MPTGRRLPPFAAIRAFEASARHLSFKAAAEEIHVTPSAISHQIRMLEDHLGTTLFVREANRIRLNPQGTAYLTDLTALLDQLEISTNRVSRRLPGAPLRVLSTPGFAARWLMPRLGRCPVDGGIEIDVSNGAPSTDFAANNADVVIHWGDNPVPGVCVEPFMESSRYPVASPELRARAGLDRPEDLLRMTLLRDEVLDGWERWFGLAGVAAPDLPDGPRLAHCELSLTAAEQGQGVTLAYDAMAHDSLADGKLVRLFEVETPPITLYSVAYPDTRARCPRIRAFRDWIFAETARQGTIDSRARMHAV